MFTTLRAKLRDFWMRDSSSQDILSDDIGRTNFQNPREMKGIRE